MAWAPGGVAHCAPGRPDPRGDGASLRWLLMRRGGSIPLPRGRPSAVSTLSSLRGGTSTGQVFGGRSVWRERSTGGSPRIWVLRSAWSSLWPTVAARSAARCTRQLLFGTLLAGHPRSPRARRGAPATSCRSSGIASVGGGSAGFAGCGSRTMKSRSLTGVQPRKPGPRSSRRAP